MAIYIGNAEDGPWTLMADITLPDPTKMTGEIPLVNHTLMTPFTGQVKKVEYSIMYFTHFDINTLPITINILTVRQG